MRESSLNTLNVNMEVELKQAKAEVHRLRTEKQSLEQEYNDLNKTKDVTTVEVSIICQGHRNVLRPKNFGTLGGLCLPDKLVPTKNYGIPSPQ